MTCAARAFHDLTGPSAVAVNTTSLIEQSLLAYTHPSTLNRILSPRVSRTGAMVMQEDDPPSKRRKVDGSHPEQALAPTDHRLQHPPHSGLGRAISPPPLTRQSTAAPDALVTPTWGFESVPKESPTPVLLPEAQQETPAEWASAGKEECTNYVSSPFQLTRIQDLGPHQNVDVVRLGDILGNPMIRECWNFNFLHDVDFVM